MYFFLYFLFIFLLFSFFFFNDTATTEIYTLSLHDALPFSSSSPAWPPASCSPPPCPGRWPGRRRDRWGRRRSEEHTSELQSRLHLVCRLLLEKKKQNKDKSHTNINKKKDNKT